MVFLVCFLFPGADANIRDYSGHKPVHYLKSNGSVQSKIDQDNVPAWKFHSLAGTKYAVSIPPHIHYRLTYTDRKLSHRTTEGGDTAAEYGKGQHRLSNAEVTDRRNSLDSNGIKAKKLARKESKKKDKKVKRKHSFLLSKNEKHEMPVTPQPEYYNPPPSPPPQPRIPVAAGRNMWKPVGPRS